MAAAIVTQEAVFALAEQLAAAGEEPTLITLRERIGGGSYTTLKRYLDLWTTQRKTAKHTTIEIPPEVVAKGEDLLRVVWLTARGLIDQETATIRVGAEHEITAAQARLTAAETEIARLEDENTSLVEAVTESQRENDQLQEHLRHEQTTVATLEARTAEQTERLASQATTIDQLRADLAATHTALAAAQTHLAEQEQALAARLATIDQLRRDLARAQADREVANARVSEQALRLTDLTTSLERAQQQAVTADHYASELASIMAANGDLTGQLAAMRQRLDEQAALLEQLTAKTGRRS